MRPPDVLAHVYLWSILKQNCPDFKPTTTTTGENGAVKLELRENPVEPKRRRLSMKKGTS